MDDLKLSRLKDSVLRKVTIGIEDIYKEMKVSVGKKHVGMDLDYSIEGLVKLSMIEYLKEAIKCCKES